MTESNPTILGNINNNNANLLSGLPDDISSAIDLLAKEPEFCNCFDFFPSRRQLNLPVIALVGEFKRGKTSLVRTLCDNQLPYKNNDDIVIVCHPQCKESLQLADLRGLPALQLSTAESSAHLLTNIILLDTPGLNDPATSEDPFLFSLLARCDRILMVLSAEQPLSGSEKKFVGRLLQEQRQKLAFVLHKCDLIHSMDDFAAIQQRIIRQVSSWLSSPIIIPSSLKPNLDCPAISGSEHLRQFLDRDVAQINDKHRTKMTDQWEWLLRNLESRLVIQEQNLESRRKGEIQAHINRSTALLEKQQRLEDEVEEIYNDLKMSLPDYIDQELDTSKAYLKASIKQLPDPRDKQSISNLLEQEIEQVIERIFRRLVTRLNEQHQQHQISTKALALAQETPSQAVIANWHTLAKDKGEDGDKSMIDSLVEKAMEILLGTTLGSAGSLVIWIKKAWDYHRRSQQEEQQQRAMEELIMVYCHELSAQLQQHFAQIIEKMGSTEMAFFRQEFLQQDLSQPTTTSALETETSRCARVRENLERTLRLFYQWKATL